MASASFSLWEELARLSQKQSRASCLQIDTVVIKRNPVVYDKRQFYDVLWSARAEFHCHRRDGLTAVYLSIIISFI